MSASDGSAVRTTILLVDDEPALLEAMRLNLEAHFEVRTATSVEGAEKWLALQQFDVVVTDHLMPNELGLNFLVRIKDRFPEMRRILVTGYLNPELLSEAAEMAELSACLFKPVRYTDIMREIRKALERPGIGRGTGERSA